MARPTLNPDQPQPLCGHDHCGSLSDGFPAMLPGDMPFEERLIPRFPRCLCTLSPGGLGWYPLFQMALLLRLSTRTLL